MMCVRSLQKEEYPVIQKWFKDWNRGEELSRLVLSDYGIVAVNDGRLIAAVFVYPILGAKFALIGWPVASRTADRKERNVALDKVFKAAEVFAKEMGYIVTCTYTAKEISIARFKRHGYKEGDKETTCLMKVLEA